MQTQTHKDRIWIEVMCPSCAEMFDTVVSVSDYAKRIAELEAQLAAATKRAEQAEQRTKKQLNEIMELSKEHERLALIIDSNNLPDTAADLISQLRLEIVAEKDRAEQAEANLELLEAQRNLAEKERRVLEFKFSEMRERAEQLRTDARRLAHIAKNVRIVSESENNLIEKYLNSKRA